MNLNIQTLYSHTYLGQPGAVYFFFFYFYNGSTSTPESICVKLNELDISEQNWDPHSQENCLKSSDIPFPPKRTWC